MSDKMREAVLKILTSYKQEMERYGYYSSNPGVSVDDFEEIADEIVAWQAARTVPDKISVLFVTDAYESGIGHAYDNLCNPYKAGTDSAIAYDIGKELGRRREINKPAAPEGKK